MKLIQRMIAKFEEALDGWARAYLRAGKALMPTKALARSQSLNEQMRLRFIGPSDESSEREIQ